MRQKICIPLILLIIICIHVTNYYSCRDFNHVKKIPNKNTTIWYECSVLIIYQNMMQDTINIDIYEDLNNIWVENGNLTFEKSTKQLSGTVAVLSKAASNVQTFKIIKNIFRSKTEI
jgi:hypothetical protein